MECYVCKIHEKNDIQYGEMLTLNDISCHYFCLLFADIPQKGEDHEGILGFLYEDIKAGVAAKKKKKCFYCKKSYATIQCSRVLDDKKRCYRNYHLICGIKSNCLFRFGKKFDSFCSKDHGLQETPPSTFNSRRICCICTEPMGEFHPLNSIPIHCCPTAYMHRFCLQKFALQAGHGLKCLVCRDEKIEEEGVTFKKLVEERGVYVPEREIQWMLNQCEGGSQDPSAPPLFCAAKICQNEDGRLFLPETPVGATCSLCQRPFHESCVKFSVIKKNDQWICFDCYDGDSEQMDVVKTEEKDQDKVEVEIDQQKVEIKRFLADAYSEKNDHGVDEEVLNSYPGPRSAEVGKFRLNYFFNSHNPDQN